MIKRLEIIELFGIENNNKTIEFNEDITILVGLNGSGKTTILNILNAIFTKRFYELTNYKFREINVESTNGNIKIIKVKNYIFVLRTDIAFKKDIKLTSLLERLSISNDINDIQFLINKILTINTAKDIEDSKQSKMSVEENFQQMFFKDLQNIYNVQEKDIIKDYFVFINKDFEKEEKHNYDEFNYSIDSIYFPTYRRLEAEFIDLLRNDMPSHNNDLVMYYDYQYSRSKLQINTARKVRTVIGHSNKDIDLIVSQKLNEINKLETELLNSLYEKFIFSLLEPLSAEYKSELDSINYQSNLQAIFGVNKENQRKIDSYVKDIKWAETVHNNFLNNFQNNFKDNKEVGKFSKASKIIESKKQIDKLVKIYQETSQKITKIKEPIQRLTTVLSSFIKKGIIFRDGSILFLSGDSELSFEDLSAGEKQLVAIFIYTWFNRFENSIVLIDEPELSLHVTWQRDFITSLTSNHNKTQYIISTHSPFVIGRHKDKIVKVGKYEEGEY